KPGIGVQALLWIGDASNPSEIKVEDWSDLAKRDICVKADDVRKIVLIVSNSNVGGTFSDSINAEALPAGCSGWRGTMSMTTSWNVPHPNGGAAIGTSTATFDGLWTLEDASKAPLGCEYEDPPCIGYVASGTITWNWDTSDTDPACSESYAGSLIAGPDGDPRTGTGGYGALQSLGLLADGSGHYRYWGMGNWYDPSVPRMQCISPRGVNSPPSYFELSDSANGSGAADATGNTCIHTTWLIDETADTISGSCWEVNNGFNFVFVEWSLHKVGDAIP